MNNILDTIKLKVYDCLLTLTNFVIENESQEYDTCRFKLNGLTVFCRNAKITPKKIGQFVTFWQRDKQGITIPYTEAALLDFYVINVVRENKIICFSKI